MVPILYASITEGTVPSDFGIGNLTDALECTVEESRNSKYELTLIYAAQGIHASEIKEGRYIKAQPNFTDAPQLFKIYHVGKALNGRIEINAEHISYALSGKPITSGTANNIVSACALLEAKAGGFTITTTKNTAGDFVITEPSSVKSWFGGKKGSLLDVYGGGEWYYNNFAATLYENRGVLTPRTSIRYGKNLTELQQTIDSSNLYTHVLAFYQNDEGVKVVGNERPTGLSGAKRVLILDATQDFENAPTSGDLDDYADDYISGHNLTAPETNFTLNFVQDGQLSERVDLCDMVKVYFEALDIEAVVKCIRVKWDVLRNRYIETEFGAPKSSIVDTISGNDAAIAQASADAAEAKAQVNGKAKVFVSTPVPPYNIGDIWTDSNDIYYCTTPRTETVTGSGSGAVVSFDTLIGGALTECKVDIEGSQGGTGTPSPLNPRPLIAFTEANISRTGTNLWDEDWEEGWLSSLDGTPTASNTAIRSKNYCRIQPEQTYYFGINDPDATQYYCAVYLYDKTQTFTRRVWCTNMTFSTNAGEYYFKLSTNTNGIYGTTYKNDMSVNYPSSVMSYSAYEGEVYTVDFDTGGIVYKGSLDVLTGELTVTHKVIDLGDLSWTQTSVYQGKKAFYSALIDDMKPAPASNTKIDAVCEQYELKTGDQVYLGQDGFSGWSTQKRVAIYDASKETMSASDFKASVEGIKLAYELATPTTYNLTPQDIQTVIGHNVVFADTGDISVSYFVDGFTMNDWSLATDYVSQSNLEDAIRDASDIITGTAGGYVVIHDSDNDGQPDEILIMNTPSIETATQIWRWNSGGLGYSGTDYNGPYKTAITSDGQIVASMITTGNLDASRVTIQHLKATMFEGGKLVLGGADNVEGVFQLKNKDNIVIGEIDKDGLKFYGAGPEGARPYVLLNNTVGFQGCDANGTPIFWVNQDEFRMKKCVAENEINACKKIRFIPVTLKDGNDQIINDGVAVVAIVQT